jgi:hypothetical protein
MRVKLSAESAMQQSLGREPQEKRRAGTSPVGAARDFLSHIKTCIALTGLFSLF